jgi:hypothetical protein
VLSLVRRDDWPERLEGVIARHRAAPFNWGVTDCATLMSEAVDAVAGFDPMAAYKPWSSEVAAMRRLSETGFRTVAEWASHMFEQQPVSFARRGDLVIGGATMALSCPAIVIGAEAVSRDHNGFVVAPLSAFTSSLKVG